MGHIQELSWYWVQLKKIIVCGLTPKHVYVLIVLHPMDAICKCNDKVSLKAPDTGYCIRYGKRDV